MSLNSSIVNAKKLVCTGSHIDIIRLALCFLLHHKKIDRIISRSILHQCLHDLKKSFSDSWSTTLGSTVTVNFHLAGLVDSGINTCKGS